MPSSRPNTIPTVIHVVRQLKPRSILDVGVGFGKWGHLFREYTDIVEAENDPHRYRRKHWKVRIDGIEGHAAYVTTMHRFLYNKIHLGDACTLMNKLPRYDLVFMGDIIEHFDKRAGQQLLQDAAARAKKALIVTTPKFETGQAASCGNELERHRSLWSSKDFHEFDGATVKTIDRDTLLAVIVKPGVPTPICKPPTQPKPDDARRLRLAQEELMRLIPRNVPFILVDEDQIRSELPHTLVIPFLERGRQYWGPPRDDATAIHELKRLCKDGAKFITFTWPAFWWLEHYAEFSRYLRSHFLCTVENDRLVVFDLRR